MRWSGRGSADVLAGSTLRLPNPLPGSAEAWPPGVVALAVSWPGASAHSTGGLGEADDFLRVGDTRDPDFQGPATVRGDITTESALRAKRYVALEDRHIEFEVCPEEGALSLERFYSGLLLCRGGTWRSAGRAAGGGFSFNTLYGCVDREGRPTKNPVTGGCFCGGGYASVLVSDSGTNPQDGRTQGYICVGN